MIKIVAAVLCCLMLLGCSNGSGQRVTIIPETNPSTPVPESTVPETMASGESTEGPVVPETQVPVTTAPVPQVAWVEQTSRMNDTEHTVAVLTAYDAQGDALWQWISPEVETGYQISLLTEFVENEDMVFVTAGALLYALDRQTGQVFWTLDVGLGTTDLAIDGEGNVYLAAYLGDSVRAVDPQGRLFWNLGQAYPEVYEQLYWDFGPEYLGDGVMKFCFEACSDPEAVRTFSYADQNEWGSDYWYVLLDTNTMELILP